MSTVTALAEALLAAESDGERKELLASAVPQNLTRDDLACWCNAGKLVVDVLAIKFVGK